MRKDIIILALISLIIGGACTVKRPRTDSLTNSPASDVSILPSNLSSLQDNKQEVSDLDVQPTYDPSVLFSKWAEQNTTLGLSGRILYPDWYGGCFEENDFLVMQCTDIEKAYLIPEGAKYRLCKYSYNELDSISDIISEHMSRVDKSLGSNVMGFGISGKLNRIQVILHNNSDEKIEEFKNNIYSDDEHVVFMNMSQLIQSNSDK
ncbi:MAG: hypothetical protein HDR88_15365 [Bacteroides sp.]|nr:hypothetical protein [Bacteroides sp.]